MTLSTPRGAAASRVTDADVERMRASGLSEDQIFEITVAVAAGAGLSRLEAARRAIAEVD